jgi:hypothetical protein
VLLSVLIRPLPEGASVTFPRRGRPDGQVLVRSKKTLGRARSRLGEWMHVMRAPGMQTSGSWS